MKSPNELATDESNDELFEGWFEQGELMAVSEAPLQEEPSARRSRAGMVIAAVSATVTVLTLVMIFAARV